jgi:hypothetical protein
MTKLVEYAAAAVPALTILNLKEVLQVVTALSDFAVRAFA